MDGPIDLLKLQEVIQREANAAEAGRINVSAGLLTEMRNERAIVGRLVNENSFTEYPKRGGLSFEGDAGEPLATEETGIDRPAAPILVEIRT
jgi:hypothetical protein